jgi:hypothetical protein
MALRARKPPRTDDKEREAFDEDLYNCLRYVGTGTVNPGNILTLTVATATIAVIGARAGMTVQLGPPAALEADLIWSGLVTADDTVTVRLYNPTGSTITPASATWTARVMP